LESSEKKTIEQREKLFGQMLFKLGCVPLKKITPAIGSSIHYAGTLPFSKKEEMFTIQPDGRLSHTKNVFVADGSGFTFLPAKGITLTLMANAHNTALNALQHA
jgi:choline dehydrogenase-like flavoprotein